MNIVQTESSLRALPTKALFRWRILRLLTLTVLFPALLCLEGQQIFAAGESSPIGTASPFNVGDVIRSAGAYSALTGTTTRTVPDLVVPGGVGAYPLVFSRTSTSRYMYGDEGNGHSFGQSGTWRHSYKWALYVETDGNSNPTGILRVHYPDGGVIRFANMAVSAPTSSSPTPYPDPYLRCVSLGVSERLEKISNTEYLLHRSDGGTVDLAQFGGNTTFRVQYVADPYGQKTVFSYWTYDDNANGVFLGKLQRVTEPGGRWLEIRYVNFGGEAVVRFVTASTSQSVQYDYGASNGYTYLGSVTTRNNTTNSSGQTTYQFTSGATYTYQADNTGAGLRPLLATCNDPNFPGPMPRIKYDFAQGNSYPYGQIQAESGIADNGTPTTVTSYSQSNLQETNGEGGQSAFAYYAYLLNTKQDYEGVNTNYTYDANWFQNSVTNRNNNKVTRVREPYAGKKLSVTRTDTTTNTTLTTTYDYGSTSGFPYPFQPYWVMKVTDPRNNQTVYTRDTFHQATQIKYADGTLEKFAYNSLGQVISHLKTDGSTQTFWFDNHGNLTASTDTFSNPSITFTNRPASPSGRCALYYYNDVRGRLSQVTDLNGHNTSYTYDDFHRVTQVLHDDGHHSDYTYDAYGNPATASDEAQKKTTFTYDNHRRPRSITVPVNQSQNSSRTTTFTYERGAATGDAHTKRGFGTVTLASGKKFQRAYTKNGRLQSETKGVGTADATTDTYTYDGEGHVKTMADANGITQASYVYDSLERKQTFTDANGHVTTWTYYEGGNPNHYDGWLKSVQPPGNTVGGTPVTNYTAYDVMGRLQKTVDPSGRSVGRSYDSVGRLQVLSDANGGYQYDYDALSRPATLHFPDGSTQTWSYDWVGNQTSFKNRAGNKYTTLYDDRNRPYQADWDDNLTVGRRWYYDDAGRLKELFNGNADLNYTYDDSGFLLTENQTNYYYGGGVTNPVTYGEDADGNVASITYPAGDVPGYTYDKQNRCVGLTGFSELWFQGEQVIGRTLGNNVATQFYRQANGRVGEVWHHHGGNDPGASSWPQSNISARPCGYAPDGQLTWVDHQGDGGSSGSALENDRGENYQYNGDNSLSRFSILYGNVYQQADSHGDSDANPGNFAGAPGAGGSGSYVNSYAYDGAGNRSQVTQMGGSISYNADGENRYYGSLYDNNSDTTDSAVGWTYGYNAEGQMISAKRQSDGYTIGFGYDGAGRQIMRAGTGGGRSSATRERSASSSATWTPTRACTATSSTRRAATRSAFGRPPTGSPTRARGSTTSTM